MLGYILKAVGGGCTWGRKSIIRGASALAISHPSVSTLSRKWTLSFSLGPALIAFGILFNQTSQ